MRQEFVELIKAFEGCKLRAYQDSGGLWTVGWGHTGNDIGPSTVWTQEQADEALKWDLYRVYAPVRVLVGNGTSIHQLEAMASLAYNIGISAFRKSTLLKKFNKEDVLGAADQFLVWNKVKGKVVDGLTNRRKKERELFLS